MGGKPKMDSVELLEKSEPDVVGREDGVPTKEVNEDDTSNAGRGSGRW